MLEFNIYYSENELYRNCPGTVVTTNQDCSTLKRYLNKEIKEGKVVYYKYGKVHQPLESDTCKYVEFVGSKGSEMEDEVIGVVRDFPELIELMEALKKLKSGNKEYRLGNIRKIGNKLKLSNMEGEFNLSKKVEKASDTFMKKFRKYRSGRKPKDIFINIQDYLFTEDYIVTKLVTKGVVYITFHKEVKWAEPAMVTVRSE